MGLYQLHNDGSIWKYTGPPISGWQELDTNPKATAIASDGIDLYQLHNDGSIWKYTGPPVAGWQELDNNPKATAIAASGGNLYELHNDGSIWRYTSPPISGWQQLDNNPKATHIVADGAALYQLHNDGSIWKYTGIPFTGWQELDNNPKATAIAASGGNLYQLHNDGSIWKYVGPPLTGWQQLDTNPKATAIAADGANLYQLHSDGSIWHYVGPPITGWQELDSNPKGHAIVASGGKLYQLHSDGSIWLYVGPPITGWQELDTNPKGIAIAAGTPGFGSNNNYIFDDDCKPLLNLAVTIHVTEDIVCQSASGSTVGFGFQLNCYSPPSETSAWQQYVVALFGSEVIAAIDNWPLTGANLINDFFNLVALPSAKIPAGYTIEINLENDATGNVTGATYVIIDNTGHTLASVTKTLLQIAGTTTVDIAPIIGFELNLVGPVNSESAVLSSGAGTFTFRATNPLTPLTQEPSCAESGYITAETANSFYGPLSSIPATTFTQTFNVGTVSTEAPMISKVGKPRPSTRR